MYPVIPASKSFLVMNFDIDTISHLPMELQRICTYMLTYSIGHGNNAAHSLLQCECTFLFHLKKSNSTTLIFLHEPINGSYIKIPYQNLEIKNVSTDHLRDCQQFTF